ncbi:ISNCY family transposase, partial [Lacticaseibacillus casei]
QKTTLHAAIDDQSGNVVGGYFAKQETLSGYYHVFAQVLRDYGSTLSGVEK